MSTANISSGVEQLTERIQDWRGADVVVDQERRAVRNVALTAAESKNGYRYSAEALRQAVPLYENKPVFLDHAANLARPFDRSTRDLVGTVVNVRFEEERVRADIQTLDTDSGRTFVALAESESPAVGMSHVVLAERGRDKTVVETIHDVVSVDAVVFPATASTFRESQQHWPAVLVPDSFEQILAEVDAALPSHWQEQTEAKPASVRRVGLFPEQILVEVHANGEAYPKYYLLEWSRQDGSVELGSALTEIASAEIENGSRLSELCASEKISASELEQVIFERDELKCRLEHYESERHIRQREQNVDVLLEQAELPAEVVTDLFREQLMSATDPADCEKLISERKRLAKQLTRQLPLSGERRRDEDSQWNDAAIVSVFRGHPSSVLTGVH